MTALTLQTPGITVLTQEKKKKNTPKQPKTDTKDQNPDFIDLTKKKIKRFVHAEYLVVSIEYIPAGFVDTFAE